MKLHQRNKSPQPSTYPLNFSAFPTLLSPLNLIQFTFAKVVNFTGKCIPFWTTQGTRKRVPFLKIGNLRIHSFSTSVPREWSSFHHVGRLVTFNQVWLGYVKTQDMILVPWYEEPDIPLSLPELFMSTTAYCKLLDLAFGHLKKKKPSKPELVN